MAVTWDSPYLIEELILQGLPIDVRDEINGFTPLHLAASHDRLECVQVLLNLKADVNAVTVSFCLTPVTGCYTANHSPRLSHTVQWSYPTVYGCGLQVHQMH